MGALEPLDDLGSGLGLSGHPHNFAASLPDLRPESDVRLSRFRGLQPSAPPIREALQSGAFCGRQPSHGVAPIDRCRVFEVSGQQRGGLLPADLGETAHGHGIGCGISYYRHSALVGV